MKTLSLKTSLAGIVCLLALTVVLFSVAAEPAHAAGTPAGTNITNTGSLSYSDANANSYTATSNAVTVTVTAVYASSLVCSTTDQSAASNTTVYYACTATNTSNTNDTIALSAASVPGWTTTLYFDTNGDGTHQAGETTVTASTGNLAADGTYRFFMAVTVPSGTANGTTSVATLNALGAGAGATAATPVARTTTAQAPNITVSKKVRNITSNTPPVGYSVGPINAKPTEVLEYQLTVNNSGALTATSAVLTDSLNANLTYVAGSLWSGSNGTSNNGAGNTNNTDGSTGETCAIDACAAAKFVSPTVTFYIGTGASEAAGGSLTAGATQVYLYYRATVN